MTTQTSRRPSTIADEVWSVLGAPPRPQVEQWVAEHLSDDELLSCAAYWLWCEVEAKERAHTLETERGAEVPRSTPPSPSTQQQSDALSRSAVSALRFQAASREERLVQLHGEAEAFILRHAEALQLTWTPDLLELPIRMPDGTVTSWGEATIPQHQLRVDMLTKNVIANVEAAARHIRAMSDLTGQAGCLNELMNRG